MIPIPDALIAKVALSLGVPYQTMDRDRPVFTRSFQRAMWQVRGVSERNLPHWVDPARFALLPLYDMEKGTIQIPGRKVFRGGVPALVALLEAERATLDPVVLRGLIEIGYEWVRGSNHIRGQAVHDFNYRITRAGRDLPKLPVFPLPLGRRRDWPAESLGPWAWVSPEQATPTYKYRTFRGQMAYNYLFHLQDPRPEYGFQELPITAYDASEPDFAVLWGTWASGNSHTAHPEWDWSPSSPWWPGGAEARLSFTPTGLTLQFPPEAARLPVGAQPASVERLGSLPTGQGSPPPELPAYVLAAARKIGAAWKPYTESQWYSAARPALPPPAAGYAALGMGTERAVFHVPGSDLDPGYVVKVPVLARARKANQREAEIWQQAGPKTRSLLVPVLASAPDGSWLVMPYVDTVVLAEDANTFCSRSLTGRWLQLGNDCWPPNVGRYQGRLVLLDYTTPVESKDIEALPTAPSEPGLSPASELPPEPDPAVVAERQKRILTMFRAYGKPELDTARAAFQEYEAAHPEVAVWLAALTTRNEAQARAAQDARIQATRDAQVAREARYAEAKRTGRKLPKDDRNRYFRAWFGDSVITRDGEPGGKPLRVVHETSKRFREFKAGEFGFHFGVGIPHGMFGQYRHEGYLRIENPYRMADAGVWTPEGVIWNGPFSPSQARDLLAEVERIRAEHKAPTEKMVRDAQARGDHALAKRWQKLLDDPSDAALLRDRKGNYQASKPVHQALRELGYDGIVYFNEVEGSKDSWIAFELWQFKSVRNIGTFDLNDPHVERLPAKAAKSPAKPPLVDRPETVYHGTTLNFLPGILARGVLPREVSGRASVHWTKTTSATFWTDDPIGALSYALAGDALYRHAAILEVPAAGLDLQADWDDTGDTISIALEEIQAALYGAWVPKLQVPIPKKLVAQVIRALERYQDEAPMTVGIEVMTGEDGRDYLVPHPVVAMAAPNLRDEPDLAEWGTSREGCAAPDIHYDEGDPYFQIRQYQCLCSVSPSQIAWVWVDARAFPGEQAPPGYETQCLCDPGSGLQEGPDGYDYTCITLVKLSVAEAKARFA